MPAVLRGVRGALGRKLNTCFSIVMERKLVFATNNAHKLSEVRQMVGDSFEILSLADIGCYAEIPETSSTFKGNALMKAEYVKNNYGYNCFADDSGLEVECLGGAPGVHSARYATSGHDHEANIDKLLSEMRGKVNRSARFLTVIALLIDGIVHYFEGEVRGTITVSRRGKNGFGYDPVFVPNGYEKTFGEMGDAEKNSISHRAEAMSMMVRYIKTIKP